VKPVQGSLKFSKGSQIGMNISNNCVAHSLKNIAVFMWYGKGDYLSGEGWRSKASECAYRVSKRGEAPLLSQARYVNSGFHPEYVICDAGYSSEALRKVIKRQWRAQPIIRAPKTHKKWIAEETAKWQTIFNRRTAVERVFGRLKDHRRLNNITVRHCRKVTVHSLLPIIVTQAVALAFPDTPRNCVW